MNKPVTPRKPKIVKPVVSPECKPMKVKPGASHEREPANAKPEASPERKPRTRSTKQGSKKAITKPPVGNFKHRLILISFEVLGLVITLVSAIMVLLGYSANRFSGTSFLTSLLPFAIGVL
jgi:hypothetical protein